MNRNRASLLPPTEEGLGIAAAHLLGGGIVGMPTETVYGLAAVVNDAEAVAKVYEAKRRPLFDPLIAHVAQGEPSGWDPFERTAALVDLSAFPQRGLDLLEQLWRRFWPGPLTTVLPRAPSVPDLVTAGLARVAVRMPAHPVAERLILAVGRPLVAPSANRFGRISPTTAQATMEELGDRLQYIVDGGPCSVGVESTVVSVEPDGAVRLLRPGGVPVEALQQVVGRVGGPSARIEAPGQTPSHYAPSAPIELVAGPLSDRARGLSRSGPIAVLVASGPVEPAVEALRSEGHAVLAARSLSVAGDEREAARNLFAALRALDASGAERIVAERWPEATGLGAAISDRLARASAPR